MVKAADADAFQVEDSARGFDRLADCSSACGESLIKDLFILQNEMSKQPVFGGDLVKSREVDLAKLLDIDRSTILVSIQYTEV